MIKTDTRFLIIDDVDLKVHRAVGSEDQDGFYATDYCSSLYMRDSKELSAREDESSLNDIYSLQDMDLCLLCFSELEVQVASRTEKTLTLDDLRS